MFAATWAPGLPDDDDIIDGGGAGHITCAQVPYRPSPPVPVYKHSQKICAGLPDNYANMAPVPEVLLNVARNPFLAGECCLRLWYDSASPRTCLSPCCKAPVGIARR